MNRLLHLFEYGSKGLGLPKQHMGVTQSTLTALLSLWLYFSRIISSIYARILLRLWGAQIGEHFRVKGKLILRVFGKVNIGDNVSINSGRLHVGGSDRKTAFRIGRCGLLQIGNGAGITNSTINCMNSVSIGEGTFIGGGCELLDTDFHQIQPEDRRSGQGLIPSAPIFIGNNVFVGGMSIIRRGVTIGNGSIVGMGSLVTKNIPPHEIWAGVPAKFLKSIEKKPKT